MRIVEIRYRRVKNLGNYESEAVEMTCAVDESDSPLDAFEGLKEYVYTALKLPVPDSLDGVDFQ